MTVTSTSKPGGATTDVTSPRYAARITGVSYLAMFVVAMVSNFMVTERLIVPGDGSATVANVSESIGLFRWAVAGFLVIVVLDVVIAWGLHVVFRRFGHDLSLASAWFRLAYSAILGAAVASLFLALQFVDGSLGDLGPNQIAQQAMAALSGFDSTWTLGLAVFGVHLALLGVLMLRSGLIPRALGFAVAAAGVAYCVDTLARIVLPDYEAVSGIFFALVAVPSILGEGWLGLWLLFTRRIDG